MSIINQLSAVYFVLSMLTGPMALQAAETIATSTINQDIEHLLGNDELSIRGVEILTRDVLLDVYRDHEFAPYWTSPDRINELLELITNSADHGLIPADYNIEQLQQVLQQRRSNPSAEIEAEADILLMESLLRYGYHRRYGKIKASSLDPDINFKREKFYHQGYPATIDKMLSSESLFDFIEMVAPTGPVYQQLQTSLKAYRAIANNDGWPTVPDGPTLRPGDNDPRVAIIRKRLAVTGRIDDRQDLDPGLFDQTLKDAVKAFQRRHLLGQDGIVGKQTIATLNVPVNQRIDQLRLSLERLRWVRQEATDTMVVVNIAGFRALYALNGPVIIKPPGP